MHQGEVSVGPVKLPAMQNPAQQQPYEHLPFPLISRDIFNPSDKRDVTARNGADDPPFTPERFIVLNPADWVVHHVTIGDRAVHVDAAARSHVRAQRADQTTSSIERSSNPDRSSPSPPSTSAYSACPFQASIWGERAMRR